MSGGGMKPAGGETTRHGRARAAPRQHAGTALSLQDPAGRAGPTGWLHGTALKRLESHPSSVQTCAWFLSPLGLCFLICKMGIILLLLRLLRRLTQ